MIRNIGLIVLAIIAGIGISVDWVSFYRSTLKSPHVKVTYADYGGHGSATHVGNGYYLTAAHVIKDGHIPMITGGIKTEIMWVNREYDIALLKADTPDTETIPIDCRLPKIGESVSLHGNPRFLEDITTYGRVAGGDVPIEKWRSLVTVDATAAGGMSGGAILDGDRELVGVLVAGLRTEPFTFIVPASTICMLMK